MANHPPTAAVLIIGNEILSGRTQDLNLNYIAKKLAARGIVLAEARVVPDIPDEIVVAVNALRARYTYLFTTGGIGATHDDITMACIARAFGVPLVEHPEAHRRIVAHYGADKLNAARLRMALMPQGAELIDNPASGAPSGFVGNVYILAGIPSIMQGMFDSVLAKLQGGAPVLSITIQCQVPESIIADDMAAIAKKHPEADIGSYPWFKAGKFGVALVVRGTDQAAIQPVAEKLLAMVKRHDENATQTQE
jgi:molybdopterin-biosynthesis enzyme MoeA-like protein